jgi:hypothetical protein
MRIKDIISKLTVIEEQIKTHPKTNQNNSNKKQLKNPCRLHNGGHEWDDCRKNPKNKKIPKETQTTIVAGTIMNMEMVKQREESIDVPKMNLLTEKGSAAVAGPGTANHQIVKNIIKWTTTRTQ